MSGRRHAVRRETLAYWPVEREDSGEAVGLVTDMSEIGLHLHSKHRFVKGRKLTVRIMADPKLSGGDHITLQIKNAWCRRSEVSDLYHSGFIIVKMSPEARRELHRLLQAFSYAAPRDRD